jgi:signal transduction histidine kinase
VEEFLNYVLVLLTQFAGGPGPKENNLVRFGLPAVLWAALLVVAWLRQRHNKYPRERLLVWGFGLASARELFMFSHVSLQLIGHEPTGHWSEPLEHALTMAAIVMVAGAFIRFILQDEKLTRRYLQIGLVVAVISFFATWWWWDRYATANLEARFNQTWGGVYFYALTGIFAGIAIILLTRRRDWMVNVVSLALAFFVLIGTLRLFNYATGRTYTDILCPICNSLHILAIPIFGYVYLREQLINKRQAQDSLRAYRDHLEELVEERTVELTHANENLQREISERQQAEAEIAWRNSELAAQNTIVGTISRSLDLDTILDTALDTVLAVLEMEAGCIFLLNPEDGNLTLKTQRGKMTLPRSTASDGGPCSCPGISQQAVATMKPVLLDVAGCDQKHCAASIIEEGFQTLVSTPLISKEQAVGALTLGTRRQDAIPLQELELLTAIGQQIGMAVENARLYRETERWAGELTLLHQVSVVLNSTFDPAEIYDQIAEQSAKLLGCQAASIFRWYEEAQQAVLVSSYGLNSSRADGLRLHLEESPLLSELIAQRRSIPIEDGQLDPRIPPTWQESINMRGLLCVPVWGAEEPLAILFLTDQDEPRRWRSVEVALVESFVNRAAVALENAYLHQQLEWAAALEERQRIAAEMHDGLAQTLSYLALRIGHATDLLKEGQHQTVLEQHTLIEGAIAQASKEVRRSIASLQESPPPRRPLQDWLAEILDDFVKDGSPPATLITDLSEPLFLPSDELEQVLRVVQEALLNACRHAGAQQLHIFLDRHQDNITIIVQDNGKGFDPDKPPEDGRDHFGLSIMRARAARIGGNVAVDSAPGQGTRVFLNWPLNGVTSNNRRPGGQVAGESLDTP